MIVSPSSSGTLNSGASDPIGSPRGTRESRSSACTSSVRSLRFLEPDRHADDQHEEQRQPDEDRHERGRRPIPDPIVDRRAGAPRDGYDRHNGEPDVARERPAEAGAEWIAPKQLQSGASPCLRAFVMPAQKASSRTSAPIAPAIAVGSNTARSRPRARRRKQRSQDVRGALGNAEADQRAARARKVHQLADGGDDEDSGEQQPCYENHGIHSGKA